MEESNSVHNSVVKQFQDWAKQQDSSDLISENSALPTVDDAGNMLAHGYREPTVAQLALCLVWLSAIFIWFLRKVYQRKFKPYDVDNDLESIPNGYLNNSINDSTENAETQKFKALDAHVLDKIEKAIDDAGKDQNLNEELDSNEPKEPLLKNDKTNDQIKVENTEKNGKNGEKSSFSKIKPPPSFDDFLFYVIVFGGIMLYFYLCDYQHIFKSGERTYSRDLFMFLVLLLFLVTASFTIRKTPDRLINRDQTEEWRGWMQVMFVWYHYFAAKETYNYIRIFIACYVWMTGFGNFSFFWIRKDFTFWRMLKMQWRLNFLVTVVCIVTDNDYMLYYICAMHTYWFLTVWIFMRVLNSWNTDRKKMAAKFFAYFVFNAIIFDIPGVGNVVFQPFYYILRYQDSMHEWLFRSGLDHYATFLGMLCAYNYPHYEKFLKYLERKDDLNHYKLGIVIKAIIGIVIGIIILIWHSTIMYRDKYEYNLYHPYTSFIPILAFIYFRNLFPILRSHYLHLFAWLGKITLETYISQLHVYMQAQAKELIVYFPGYPLITFAMATAVYLFIAYWLFQLTTEFSAYLLPADMKKVGINFVVAVIVCSAYAGLAFTLKNTGII